MDRRAFIRNTFAFTAAAMTGVHAHGVGRTLSVEPPATATQPFPRDFLFGTATSAVQIEGAWRDEGKGESVWDHFSRLPGMIEDRSTPDVACNSYHRWREDVELLKRMNMNSFRFSIAWPRIFPTGKGKPNRKGLDHYSKLVDALLEAEIRPLATAFHWDLPQALEDEGGWPNRETANRFADYVEVLARHLGDRVKHWCLLNEPQAFTVVGYGWGTFPPGKRDRTLMLRATHTANLAQALGFRAMKAHDSSLQMGCAYDFDLCIPATDSEQDRAACKRYDAFRNRWFMDPAFTGKYPDVFEGGVPVEALGMKPGDEELLKVPLDYSGVNYYCGRTKVAAGDKFDIFSGLNAHTVKSNDGQNYTKGMREVLLHMWREYKRPIEITETGFEQPETVNADGRIHDPKRIQFLREVLTEVQGAINDGANVRAIHIWSLLDDWEWSSGFKPRIGLTYVDYKNHQKRILKDSALWYSEAAKTRTIPTN